MLDPRRKRLLHLLLYKSYAELRAESLRLRMLRIIQNITCSMLNADNEGQLPREA